MKSLGLICSGIILGAVAILFLLPDQGERCQTMVVQERAGAQIVMSSLAERVTQVEEDRTQAEIRAIKLHAEHVKLQQEFGRMVGAQVVIPEPAPRPVSMTGAAGIISALNRWAPGLVQPSVRGR